MYRHDLSFSATTESELERQLRALPAAPGPDARFRAELRLQLMAAVQRGPEIVAAPVRPRFRLHLGRRVVAAIATGVAVLIVITGTTYWLAQRALPGDALYGIKRAGESADLSTKQGDQSRGNAYLALSTTRIDEAVALVKRATASATAGPQVVTAGHTVVLSASGPLSPRVDELVRDVLAQGDTSAVTATRLLTTASVTQRAVKPVLSIAGWLSDQRGTVRTLVERLPEKAKDTAGGQARILQRDLASIQSRVQSLSAGLGCRTCTFSKHDRFGPLPCQVCPAAPAATPSRPASPSATPTGTSSSGAPTAVTLLPPVTIPVNVPSAPATGTTVAPTQPPPTQAAPTGPPPTPPATTVTAPGTTVDPTTPSPTVAPTTPTDTPTTSPAPTTDSPTDSTTDDTTAAPTDLPTCLPPLCIPTS